MRHINDAHRMGTTAILYLKSVYDTVQRKILYLVLTKRLKKKMIKTIGSWLQPVEIRTQRTAQKCQEISRGECCKAPLEPHNVQFCT